MWELSSSWLLQSIQLQVTHHTPARLTFYKLFLSSNISSCWEVGLKIKKLMLVKYLRLLSGDTGFPCSLKGQHSREVLCKPKMAQSDGAITIHLCGKNFGSQTQKIPRFTKCHTKLKPTLPWSQKQRICNEAVPRKDSVGGERASHCSGCGCCKTKTELHTPFSLS